MDDTIGHNNDELIELQAAYANIYNEIVQPDKIFVATQYFRKKWVPRLNSNLAWLIIALRQHCYWNRETNEIRDWCVVNQAELAKELGIDTRSIRRLLKMEHADKFILEVDINRYRYDHKLGKRVRKKAFYRIRMDDPLIPEDETLLKQRLAEEMAGLSIDPETGQADMFKLLDRPLTANRHLPEKMSDRSPEVRQSSLDSHQTDKESGRSNQKHSIRTPNHQTDKESGRSSKRTKSPQYDILEKKSGRPDHQTDKESATLYTGQNVRYTDSTIDTVPGLQEEIQQQQYIPSAAVKIMADFGIGEPALTNFKNRPLAQISGWVEYAEENGLGPGYVVKRLKTNEWPPPRSDPENLSEVAAAHRAAQEEAAVERRAALESAGVRPEDLSAWEHTLAQLERQMVRETFRWLKGTEPVRREGETLVIRLKTGFALEWVQNRLKETIEQVARGYGLQALTFEVD